eukprot:EG_transcript_969
MRAAPLLRAALLLAGLAGGGWAKQECIPETEDGICFCNLEDVPEGPEENSPGGPIVFFIALAFFIGVISRRFLKFIPYTVQLYVYGLILGHIALQLKDSDGVYHLFGISIAEMDPRLMLTLFLPILLFESAFFVDISTFRRVAVHAGLLAGPGCVVTTVLMAIAIRYVYPDWTWGHACLVGAILSATDPVAVVAILKEVGASKKTSAIIEGESLLNDAVAILIFDVLHDYHRHGELAAPSEIAALTVRLVLGGPTCGWIAARLVTWLQRTTFNDALVETSATFAGAYLSYYISEEFLHSSGVLTLVSYGLVLNYRRSSISPEVEHFMEEFWHIVVYFANTLIFIVVGIQTRWALSNWSDFYGGLGKMAFLFLALNVFRFLLVYSLLPVFNLCRVKLDWRNAFLVGFGGIRGAVGLALAMEVAKLKTIYMPSNVANLVTYHVGGLVMLTIIFNGLLTSKVVQLLGIADIPPHRKYAMQRALHYVKRENDRRARMLQGDAVLADAPWDRVEYETAERLTNPWSKALVEELTPDEKLEMSRVQVLRAFKLEVWQRYRDGLARQTTIRRLLRLADIALDDGYTVDQVANLLILRFLDPPKYPVTAAILTLLSVLPVTKERQKPKSVFATYDIGFNFMQALQAVQDRIAQLCADEACTQDLKDGCSAALGIVRKYLQGLDIGHPEVTQSIKMRAAARTLLNADRKAVKGLISGGLLEENDGELLIHRIEKCMWRLEDLPQDITLTLPEQVLSGTSWFQNLEWGVQEALLACRVEVRQENECIQQAGEPALGLGVVVHGVVRATLTDPAHADYLGPGQAFNVLSTISSQRSTETLHAHAPQTSYYWFPLEVVQALVQHWPQVKRDLMRGVAGRLCAHILSRYLPYALWGKSRTLANAERGWLLNLGVRRDHTGPLSPRDPVSGEVGTPVSDTPPRHGSNPQSPANHAGTSAPSAGDFLQAVKISGPTPPSQRRPLSSSFQRPPCARTTSVNSFRTSGPRVFPRPQRVLADLESSEQEQVLVAMVPQYDYVLLHGTATYAGAKAAQTGPCLLRGTTDRVGSLLQSPTTESASAIPPTWVKFTADSWLVAIPRFEMEFDDEGEYDDDPRGSPLAGSGDLVDYSALEASFGPGPGEAGHQPHPLASFFGSLATPRLSRHEEEEGRVPLLDSLGRWGRKRLLSREPRELPDSRSGRPSSELFRVDTHTSPPRSRPTR